MYFYICMIYFIFNKEFIRSAIMLHKVFVHLIKRQFFKIEILVFYYYYMKQKYKIALSRVRITFCLKFFLK